MPQLNGGGDPELGANDEMISFKDEGDQEEKILAEISGSEERDLADLKSSLVNESEISPGNGQSGDGGNSRGSEVKL